MLEWFQQPYEDRVKAVVNFQRFRTSLFDFLARLATFCSDEEFYLGLFPILYWGPVCNPKFAWNLCVCIGLGLPIGNFLKNIYCIRRPSSPLIWQHHTSNEEHEFAFPSTHAILASSVSLIYAFNKMTTESQTILSIILWILFIMCWTLSISLSRVYLGAHSFQDVVIGSLIGFPYGVLLFMVLETLHNPLIYGSPWAWLSCSFLILFMLHTHPIDKSTRLNFHLSEGTFDYSAPVLGLALGGFLSRTWYHPVSQHCIPFWNTSLLLRYLVGAPLTIATYILVKKTLPLLIQPILKFLNVKAHYIPYSEFAHYVGNGIKVELSDKVNNLDVHNNHNGNHEVVGNENGKVVNPEGLLAWGRIYAKFLLYVFLTYTIAVFVPVFTGLWLSPLEE